MLHFLKSHLQNAVRLTSNMKTRLKQPIYRLQTPNNSFSYRQSPKQNRSLIYLALLAPLAIWKDKTICQGLHYLDPFFINIAHEISDIVDNEVLKVIFNHLQWSASASTILGLCLKGFKYVAKHDPDGKLTKLMGMDPIAFVQIAENTFVMVFIMGCGIYGVTVLTANAAHKFQSVLEKLNQNGHTANFLTISYSLLLGAATGTATYMLCMALVQGTWGFMEPATGWTIGPKVSNGICLSTSAVVGGSSAILFADLLSDVYKNPSSIEAQKAHNSEKLDQNLELVAH